MQRAGKAIGFVLFLIACLVLPSELRLFGQGDAKGVVAYDGRAKWTSRPDVCFNVHPAWDGDSELGWTARASDGSGVALITTRGGGEERPYRAPGVRAEAGLYVITPFDVTRVSRESCTRWKNDVRLHRTHSRRTGASPGWWSGQFTAECTLPERATVHVEVSVEKCRSDGALTERRDLIGGLE